MLTMHSKASECTLLFPGTWSSPPMTGSRPPPCSGFSLTTVDENRAVLFGGYQPGRERVNDVYILHFNDMV